MGIYIHLAVSRSVTQEEWTPVYEESLKMADALNLAEYSSADIHGVSVDCLIKTREREYRIWGSGATYNAWCAQGDYKWLTSSEDNILRREIGYTPKKDAVDPLLALARQKEVESHYCTENPWACDYADYWNGKTQGRPQHISLLAIGFMMEDRLKNRVFVHGDITRAQCREAVKKQTRFLRTLYSCRTALTFSAFSTECRSFLPAKMTGCMRFRSSVWQTEMKHTGTFCRCIFRLKA